MPAPHRPGLTLAALLLLGTAAQADLRRTAPLVLDLTAPARAIDLAAPEPVALVAIVDRGRDRALNLNLNFAAIIAQAAFSTGVPESFLLRLLRQESGLNPQAVSVKGAQGIAQFMPATAAEMGLDDPFDPMKAIPKAAELLRNLRGRYGNWGLAAAAYNAGPGRVDAWLLGRSILPTETLTYVASITGIDVGTWAGGKRLPGFGTTGMSLQAALTSTGFGLGSGGLTLPGAYGTGIQILPVAAGREAAAHPARTSSKAFARAQLVPRDPTGPCAALLDASSRCLAYTRY